MHPCPQFGTAHIAPPARSIVSGAARADTPADTYRELVTKLKTVPGVTEVMWDGEREIFMLVSGKKKLVYTKWAEDVATIAGISIRSSRAHNSPVGVMLSSLLDCGHDHH